MADVKTTDETAASALTGAEILRLVQGGANRRATAQEIADLAPAYSLPTLASGRLLGNSGAGSAAAAETTLTALIDRAFGSTAGAILLRGASGWEKLDPGNAEDILTMLGSPPAPAWAQPAGGGSPAGGSGAGLFGSYLTTPPTTANTGFSSWVNQGGATVTDGVSGLRINAPANAGSNSLRIRTQSAPVGDFTRKALIALSAAPSNYSFAGIGFSDGTKIEYLALVYNDGWKLQIPRFTNATTYAGSDSYSPLVINGNPVWQRIRRSSSTIYFDYSATGDDDDFVTLYSIAEASGFLGSSGYSNLVFVTDRFGATTPAIGTMMYWG